MLDKNSSTRRNLDLYLMQKGIEIAPEIELESNDLLVEFAKIGLGIACVLRESALSSMEKNDVFEVKTNEKLPLRKLGVISMKDVPLSQASYKFVELLVNN
jgi:DNA-binding transcriptional LysR family regulator